ncbi:MAG: U32 family peptidase [Christensenellales bacterium]
MKKVELLAPAGSFQKLKTAYHFGADAVYVGGKELSLRAGAENFDRQELSDAVTYAHSIGKKIYVTVNIYAKNSDLPYAKEYFEYLKKINVDAVIVSDPGLISLAKETGIEIHLSTQANTQNEKAVEFWAKQGVSRVVLGRELTLKEIKEIAKSNPSVELEIFVHGAMCVSYSGRCLLSNYFTGRDANRGECAQICRWDFKIRNERYEGKELIVEEDDRGTYFINSKDLILLPYLPDLLDGSVASFKIEGRMKSEFYLATVVNAYRKAIDEYYNTGEILNVQKYIDDLSSVVSHGYTNAFIEGQNLDTINYDSSKVVPDTEFAALVKKSEDDGVIVEMRNRFKTGDELFLVSSGESHGKSFKVDRIINSKGEEIDDAKLVQEKVKIFPPFKVLEGDLFRVNRGKND